MALAKNRSSLVLGFFGCRERLSGGSSGRIDDSAFEQGSIKSHRASMYVFLPVVLPLSCGLEKWIFHKTLLYVFQLR